MQITPNGIILRHPYNSPAPRKQCHPQLCWQETLAHFDLIKPEEVTERPCGAFYPSPNRAAMSNGKIPQHIGTNQSMMKFGGQAHEWEEELVLIWF